MIQFSKNKSLKYFFFLALFFIVPNFLFAAPAIDSISGTLNDGQSVTIAGSGFGTKTVAAPAYFFGNQNNTVGQLPVGLTSSDTTGGGFVANDNDRVSGVPNIKWRYQATAPTGTDTPAESWGRDVFDFGASPVTTEQYWSAWVYMDRSGSTCDKWQWKYVAASPSHEGYFTYPDEAGGGGMWYWSEVSGWSMYTYQEYYSPYVTNNLYPEAGNHFQMTNAFPSDGWLWNQWQRMEFYEKMSDTGDGVVYMNRIGRAGAPMELKTSPWYNAGPGDMAKGKRYVGVGMSIAAVSRKADACNGEGKTVDFKLWNDQLYIDNTQARIELCDSATWATRTHCEIQPTTAWSDISSTITLNQGSFANGNTAYLYVVDANGAVNADGRLMVLGSVAGDTLAPSAPSGLSVL